MRLLVLLLLAGCAVSSIANPTAGDATEGSTAATEPFSSVAYNSCMACHLDSGSGVPGAFPPLRNRSATIAGIDGGRDYLITVASFGLMGTIEVEGMQYFGVMPGNKGTMDAAAIASALNYIVFELNDDDQPASDVTAFTAAEIEQVQSAVETPNPQVAFELRNELATQHGEEWPR